MAQYIDAIYQGETEEAKQIRVGLDYATDTENFGEGVLSMYLTVSDVAKLYSVNTEAGDSVADSLYKLQDVINQDTSSTHPLTARVYSWDSRYMDIYLDVEFIRFTATPVESVVIVSYLPESFYGWCDDKERRKLPPLDARQDGWRKDQHPPAEWWNWGWNTMQMFINHMTSIMLSIQKSLGQENIIGEIKQFLTPSPILYANDKWLQCDGSVLDKSKYPELAEYMIGLGYWDGDPQNPTVYLPDAGGRALTGTVYNSGDVTLSPGGVGGSRTTTVTNAMLPDHTHVYQKTVVDEDNGGTGGAFGEGRITFTGEATTRGGDHTTSPNTSVDWDNMPPFLSVYMYIRAKA